MFEIDRNRRPEVTKITSKRLQGTTRQLFFQIDIALIAGDEPAEYLANSPVAFRKFNHAVGERRAPKVSVESTTHL